ncbi:MAG: hypothetical protein HY904_06865 [Deltaproteobacteria bacterium]|nr:hypothetical protein [Deltaproteobacteria bacterium]
MASSWWSNPLAAVMVACLACDPVVTDTAADAGTAAAGSSSSARPGASSAVPHSSRADAGTPLDAGPPRDAAPPADAAAPADAAVPVDAGACTPGALATGFTLQTGGGQPFSTAAPRVVLSGTLPADVGGTAVDAVHVNGSTRGTALDLGRRRWSWQGALEPGDNAFSMVARGGANASATLTTTVTLTAAPAAETAPAFGANEHYVGSWFFTWFTGDPAWECSSPWWPVAGFSAWNGSPEWARTQLLDMMDAHLDLVGLQYDTKDTTLPVGYRAQNVFNVMTAYRQLLEEGRRPPRMAMFLDTAILAALHKDRTGADLDVSGEPGRAEFYDYLHVYHSQLNTILGARWRDAAVATWGGRPILAFWHTDTGSIVGASSAFVADLKARFQAEFGVEPYLVAHPNLWSQYADTDEITQMFGPPQHFFEVGHDGAAHPTINITAGFWNPVSNPFYLPRLSGTNYDNAWAAALARRGAVRHLYIDSWNETGEGSGLLDAVPVNHDVTDTGSCGTWVSPHADGWGPSSRHYIDVTAARAAEWNDNPEDDAELLVHDLPLTLQAGEVRAATVVVRNLGDAAWTAASGHGLRAGGISTAPVVDLPAGARVVRGDVHAFPVVLAAPCTAGTVAVPLAMEKHGTALLSLGETQVTIVP